MGIAAFAQLAESVTSCTCIAAACLGHGGAGVILHVLHHVGPWRELAGLEVDVPVEHQALQGVEIMRYAWRQSSRRALLASHQAVFCGACTGRETNTHKRESPLLRAFCGNRTVENVSFHHLSNCFLQARVG